METVSSRNGLLRANKQELLTIHPRTKLSYSKGKNAVLNPSKSFPALKKSTLRFCRLLKDHSLKNMGKNTELTHPLARR